MKIKKKYTLNFIVHAISVMDLVLLEEILRPLAHTVKDKSEVGEYLFDLERIFRELDFEDTYFKVDHGACTNEGCPIYKYTFIANNSQSNFILYFF